MLELTSTSQLLGALATARSVDVQAYTLNETVSGALEAAARRGEHVVVHLESTPFADANGELAKRNRAIAVRLHAAGADARLEHPLHAKAIDIDGTLYLDDQNWGMKDLVLRDGDPDEVASIPMRKIDALEREANVLRSARASDDVIVESESFGGYNPVYYALKALCNEGEAPRLLVSARDLRGNRKERAALDELEACGVRVRVCDDSEKFARVGDHVWIGSANATAAFGKGAMPDWGVDSDDPTIVKAVHDRVEARWATARKLKRRRV